MSEAEDRRPTKHDNLPPIADILKDLLEGLQENLLANESELIARYDEMKAMFGRMPAVVDSPEINAKFGDVAKKQFGELKAALKAKQSLYKLPFTEGGKTVDGTFKRRADEVEEWQRELQERQTRFNLKVKAEADRIAAEQARIAREAEDAARKAAELAAKAVEDAKSLDDAIAAEAEAERARAASIAAQQATQTKSTDITRVRGDQGSVSSLRMELKGEVIDRAALPMNLILPFISMDELNRALAQHLKLNGPKSEKDPLPNIPGTRIWWNAKTR